MTRTQKLGTTLVFLSMAVSASTAGAETPLPLCSPAKSNPDCVIELDRDDPIVPLPVRMAKGKTLTVRVKKHIFDTVTFDATATALAPLRPWASCARARCGCASSSSC